MPIESHPCPVVLQTRGPAAHFFGYYDTPPWNAAGTALLALEAESLTRMPVAGEMARVGLVDAASGDFTPLAETRAWNWQQGSSLHWLPRAPDREIVYNDCRDGRHVAVVLDIVSGRERVLPRAVYNLAADGSFALSINFARLADERAVVGYPGATDPWRAVEAPEDDGIWRMDMATGSSELLVSLHDVATWRAKATMAGVKHRFEHVMIAPDDRRFYVLQRWPRQVAEDMPDFTRKFWDRLISIGVDGRDWHLLCDDDFVSHFCWRDPEHVLTWAHRAQSGTHYYLLHDRHEEAEIVGGEVLDRDGHCSYSPDRRWILSDSYPQGGSERLLLLYEVATGGRVDIGAFASLPPWNKGDIRCDLHPRWSRDGRQVCFDSVHEGTRQLYVLDVGEVVGR